MATRSVRRLDRRASRGATLAGATILALAGLTLDAGAANVQLTWTAPGDDGSVGRAASYDLRYSTNPVGIDTVTWWSSATVVGSLPAPRSPGQIESYSVAGLDSNTTYYFLIQTADEVPNWSGYSNVATRIAGVPGGQLPTPGGFTATIVSGGVQLGWERVSDPRATGYHIYRGAPGVPGTSPLTSLPISTVAWIDSTAEPGFTYAYGLSAFGGAAESVPATVVISVPGATTVAGELLHVYPNPTNGPLTVRFSGGSGGRARIVVYDLVGHQIRLLWEGIAAPGQQSVTWDLRTDGLQEAAPGLYQIVIRGATTRGATPVAVIP